MRKMFVRGLNKAPRRAFAGPPAPVPTSELNPKGPIVIPGLFTRDDIMFPKADIEEKNEARFHHARMLADVLRKRTESELVDQNLITKQKYVIHPLRVRHELDNIDHLISKKLVPMHIYPREGHPGLDFVLDQSQVRAIRNTPQATYRHFYVRHGNEEIRCSLHSISISPDKQFYMKVYLNRYIVGKPNIVKMEMTVPWTTHEGFRNKQINWTRHDVQLISYNDVVPERIELDSIRLARNGRITFGDLQNALPPGLELMPKMKHNLRQDVLRLEGLASKKEADAKHQFNLSLRKHELEDIVTVVDDTVFDIDKMTEEQMKALAKKQNMPYVEAKRKLFGPPREKISAKKYIKDEQARLKAELEKKLANQNLLLGVAGKK